MQPIASPATPEHRSLRAQLIAASKTAAHGQPQRSAAFRALGVSLEQIAIALPAASAAASGELSAALAKLAALI